MPLTAGSKLGPYEVLGQIGAGGMGEVYRARDERLKRDVAAKVLPASFSSDGERLRRFEQEAQAAGALNHPNILAIYDVGTFEGEPYVVSELLEGETMRSRIASGALPQRKAVDYAVQIAHGLAAARLFLPAPDFGPLFRRRAEVIRGGSVMRFHRIAVVFSLVCLLAAMPGKAQTDPHAGHAQEKAATPAVAPVPRNEALPAEADQAKEALAKSPRHGEWVDIKLPDGGKLATWVVYPEVKSKAGVVIVIHEIFGLTDWVRGVADQLAKEGFIAVAPDLLSGKGPNGGGTDSLGEDATKVIRTLTPETVIERLNAARDYALKLPAANGKVGSVGFCWGGTTSFAYAVAQPKLDAAVVYYGTSPSDTAAYAKISAPVLGLYGGDDARVDATIPTAETEMKKLNKRYTPRVFEGAGHGFLRQLSGKDGANRKAAEQAWPATLAFFRELLK